MSTSPLAKRIRADVLAKATPTVDIARLTELRNRLGLSQEEVASYVELKSHTSISHWETGLRPVPAKRAAVWPRSSPRWKSSRHNWRGSHEGRPAAGAVEVSATSTTKVSWSPVIERAAEIVRGYDTGVTLRQLFYRLVSEGLISNERYMYQRLSKLTAKGRRDGTFPPLIDRTESVHQYQTWSGVAHARHWLASRYRRDRTEGQEYAVYIGVEKHGLVNQLLSWFGGYGIPIISLGGYGSQTHIDDLREELATESRERILLYGGDFDPEGEDIGRDFIERGSRHSGNFDDFIRVALTLGQIEEYNLPPEMGNTGSPRASGFIAKYGELMQVELDALPPDVPRLLYSDALRDYWDPQQYEEVLAEEAIERAELRG